MDMKKKCITCGEVKPFTDFHNQFSNECIICKNARSLRNNKKRWSTEIGFLAWKYSSIKNREKKHNDMSHRCCFTFKEFCGAFEEHKEKLGMRSAWGPHHLPITMIYLGGGGGKRPKRIRSNLSPDRLDSSKPYTIQNLIFIRNDENVRKKDTTYEDCVAQIKLHEERFMKDKKSTSGDITSPKM
tara:strand:+ start:42 stop:596 length:555 start_codon:yes stop_codon:yes gene_type:complete